MRFHQKWICVVLFCFLIVIGYGQTGSARKLILLHSGVKQISYKENGQLYKNAWTISPNVRPDIHTAYIKGAVTEVSFISDRDSVNFTVKPGSVHQFAVIYNNDTAYTEIHGEKYVPPATFTKAYIQKNNHKILTEIPEVYELVNIIMAITPSQRANEWADEKRSNYYREVINYFDQYHSEPAVMVVDSLLKKQLYHQVKMDAYAFEFDNKGQIVPSNTYNRISWGGKNTLTPFIKSISEFSITTNFRSFYKKHRDQYSDQVKVYRDSVNIADMARWLKKNFPTTDYNAFKVIWSPIVGGSQSANMFENNGFKEAQMHVNFPYLFLYNNEPSEIINLKRGNIIFTELNHCFINPEADKYAKEINEVLVNLETWGSKSGSARFYNRPYTMFTEYLNWGLVSLRYIDYAPQQHLESLISQNEQKMKQNGFIKFPEFNRFLVQIYKSKSENQTIADLYPQIISWFKTNQ